MRTKIASAVCFTSLALTLASACKASCNYESAGDEGTVTVGTFTCKDVKDDVCIGSTDRFADTVPVIHFTHTTKDLPKNGDVYKVDWIAEDVGASAPPNTVIDTFEEKVTDVVGGTATYTANSSLTRPANGSWPKGSYRVEVKLNDKVTTTARFKIE